LKPSSTPLDTETIRYSGKGTTSGRSINIVIEKKPMGHGIVFDVTTHNGTASIPALAANVVNTLRNVVLGKESIRLCIVEHLLAALTLCGVDDARIKVGGPELPLEDGSAKFWVDCLQESGWKNSLPAATIELPRPIVITPKASNQSDKLLMAIPDDSFSINYLMDWDHPLIGKRWQSWTPAQDIHEIADARTFGWMSDHQKLGIAEDSLNLTADGFSKPLRYEDEPVRHKLLDLLGDLTLSGINPMHFKARFVSIKGGHELDVQMATELSKLL
jgi:UDP-3-O-[3-hydroxymyristoyl] N-acetylglucosamine deacetylase